MSESKPKMTKVTAPQPKDSTKVPLNNQPSNVVYSDRYGIDKDMLKQLDKGRERARQMKDIILKHWGEENFNASKHNKAVFSTLHMYVKQLDIENMLWMQQVSNMASSPLSQMTVGSVMEIMTEYFEDEFQSSEKALAVLAVSNPYHGRDFEQGYLDKAAEFFEESDTKYDVVHGYKSEKKVPKTKIPQKIVDKLKAKQDEQVLRKTEADRNDSSEKPPAKKITSEELAENEEVEEELQEVEKEYEELPIVKEESEFIDVKVSHDRDHEFFKNNSMEEKVVNISSLKTPEYISENGISSSKKLMPWEIALITVGGAMFLALFGLFTYICVRKFCIRNNDTVHKSVHKDVKGAEVESFGHERIADKNLGDNNLVDVALSNQPTASHKYSVFSSNV